jgi:hypothetical protein
MIELLKLLAYGAAGLWVLVMMSMALTIARRRREVRRMHQVRKDNSMEFGQVDGPRFERCNVCGHVRHG